MQLKQSLSMYRKYNYVTPLSIYTWPIFYGPPPFFLLKNMWPPLILPPHLHPLRDQSLNVSLFSASLF